MEYHDPQIAYRAGRSGHSSCFSAFFILSIKKLLPGLEGVYRSSPLDPEGGNAPFQPHGAGLKVDLYMHDEKVMKYVT